jgi:hypothetical protein
LAKKWNKNSYKIPSILEFDNIKKAKGKFTNYRKLNHKNITKMLLNRKMKRDGVFDEKLNKTVASNLKTLSSSFSQKDLIK